MISLLISFMSQRCSQLRYYVRKYVPRGLPTYIHGYTKGSLVIRRNNLRRLTKETPKEAHQNTISHILIPLYNLTYVDRQTWEDLLDPLSGIYSRPHFNKRTPFHTYSRNRQSLRPELSDTILQPWPGSHSKITRVIE